MTFPEIRVTFPMLAMPAWAGRTAKGSEMRTDRILIEADPEPPSGERSATTWIAS